MKTKEEIKAEIERVQAEIQNAINERNFCIQKAEQLAARVNYLSGKIDTLKELSADAGEKDG